MVSHTKVAEAFARGDKATGNRMFTDGDIIYSYGYHFPIAYRLKSGVYLFNTDRYSSSTSKHQSYVDRCINGAEVIECTTKEIKSAIDNPGSAIIIQKEKVVATLQEALDILKNVCKEKGWKRFPMKKVRGMFESRIVLEQI